MGQFLGFMGRWLYIGLAVIAILMGLQLMRIISIPLPFQKTRAVKTKGLLGAFLLGMLPGTVSSPCATPVLAVILAYVSTQGDILYGGSLLFVYALGRFEDKHYSGRPGGERYQGNAWEHFSSDGAESLEVLRIDWGTLRK
jgi:hypothetical protein